MSRYYCLTVTSVWLSSGYVDKKRKGDFWWGSVCIKLHKLLHNPILDKIHNEFYIMSNMQTTNIDDITKRLLPLTVLRRKAGEVLSKLEEVGEMLITKDGKPVAKLSSLTTTKVQKANIDVDLKKLKSITGGYRLGKISPKQIKKIINQQYERVLPR